MTGVQTCALPIFTADSEEAVFDGAFHESYFQSAPYFAISIDGIEWLNSAF